MFKAKKRYAKAVCDCSGDELITEQSHKADVDINNIIKRHGMDLINKTALLKSQEYRFDDVTGNDFQEAMYIIKKAEASFQEMPLDIKKRFNFKAEQFLDFVQNPANVPEMIELGLATKVEPDQPIEVIVTNPEPAPETP